MERQDKANPQPFNLDRREICQRLSFALTNFDQASRENKDPEKIRLWQEKVESLLRLLRWPVQCK